MELEFRYTTTRQQGLYGSDETGRCHFERARLVKLHNIATPTTLARCAHPCSLEPALELKLEGRVRSGSGKVLYCVIEGCGFYASSNEVENLLKVTPFLPFPIFTWQ